MAVIALSTLLATIGKEIVIDVLLDKVINAAFAMYNNYQVDRAVQDLVLSRQQAIAEFDKMYDRYTNGEGFDEIFESVVQDAIDETVSRSDRSLGAHITRKEVESIIREDKNIHDEVLSQVRQQLDDERKRLHRDYVQQRLELAQQYKNPLSS